MFIALGKHGTPIRKRIELSFKDPDRILAQLEQGKELTDILCPGNGPYFTAMAVLCPRMSFEKAHEAALQYCQRTRDLFRTLVSRSAYSLFIFLFSFAMICFFSDLIYPQMADYARDFGPVLFILRNSMNGLGIGLIAFFIILLYVFCLPQNKRIEHHLQRYPFMKKIVSAQLASLLAPLTDTSLSTRDALYLCASVKGDYRLRRCVQDVLEQLEKGKSLLEACGHCDPELITFVTLGMESMNMKAMLELYLLRSKKQMDRLVHKIVRVIQMISYTCVGLLVFAAYQILLSPLNVLYTI